MKYILLLSVFLFTLNCSINKVSNIHGYRSIESKFDIIIGPFANKSRLDMIANSLTKNNYSFTIENGK